MRRCDTCTKLKLFGGERCRVLHVMIGKKQDCWAWTDDPWWEARCEEAKAAYRQTRGEAV